MTTAPSTARKLIRVGHSPDPDDAFMFYALAKEKIPMRGFQVEHVIEDIESLNQRALQVGAYCNTPLLEVSAVSCHAYAYLADRYLILRSGASVGDHYGPVLVRKNRRGEPTCSPVTSTRTGPPHVSAPTLKGKRIAVPGKLTTAYLALQIYALVGSDPNGVRPLEKGDEKGDSHLFEPVFIPFDRIFQAVQSGQADLGLLIHEGQITYEEKGFEKVVDLGQWWHDTYKLPLPLGIDVIRRDLGRETIQSFTKLFKESIQYALAHREEALEYALRFGRGIGKNLGDRFVGMYVNDYTVDLGEKGEEGLRLLYRLGWERGILPEKVPIEFVERV